MTEINKIVPEINKIISFILNPTFTGWLLVLKFLFIFSSLLLIGFIILALIKTTWLKRLIIWDLEEFLTYRPFGLRKVERDLQKIKTKLETEMESEWKLAVIEADKILDDILSKMDIGGTSLGERLNKLNTDSLPNVEEVKEAHKIRNNIIHDPTYKLSLEEAKRVISIYEKTLGDLHAL